MKAEVAILGSPSLIVLVVSGCRAMLNLNLFNVDLISHIIIM